MARLIDADAFFEEHCADCKYFNVNGICYKDDPVCGAAMIVAELPTVDAVEVVHAKWITDDKSVTYCENCRHIDDYASVHNYCPNCGAKMDLEA